MERRNNVPFCLPTPDSCILFRVRIIAVANQKGGVGKTTTAVALGCGLARSGKRVLLVDCDPQGNATTSLGLEKGPGVAEAFRDPGRLSQVRQRSTDAEENGLDLACGTFRLRELDAQMARNEVDRENLARAIRGVSGDYDFVLIDCPPALNHLTLAGLAAAAGVLIPVQAEFLSLEGLAQMKEVLERLRTPQLFGILLTQVPGPLDRARDRPGEGTVDEIRAEIDRFFPNALFESMIRRDPAIAECPSHGRSVFAHAPRSVGAYHYLRFVQEATRRALILEPASPTSP